MSSQYTGKNFKFRPLFLLAEFVFPHVEVLTFLGYRIQNEKPAENFRIHGVVYSFHCCKWEIKSFVYLQVNCVNMQKKTWFILLFYYSGVILI